jgi:predicted TIM-barrel fold metal-dependent hydrolase
VRIPFEGAIDCDVHVSVPSVNAIVPYLDEYWLERVRLQQLERLDLSLTSYPPTAPLSGRPDWRPQHGPPGCDLELLQTEALDKFGLRYAILNCLWGSQALFAEDMAAAFCRAVNDWIAAEWLDKDARLRASIMVPMQNPDLAVAEIERRAGDSRFVQVLVLAGLDTLLGRRVNWPVLRAAAAHGLPIAIHAGSAYRHPPSASGWPSFLLEDYVSNTQLFAAQLGSLVSEGKPPFDVIRDHVKLTLQPADAPADPQALHDVIAQIGSDDMLLFASDFPHWQFDGDNVLPDGLSDAQLHKILVENPLATYSRLKEVVV